jgi:hypothetical protein
VFVVQARVAFAKAEIMHGIEHVCFSHAVEAGETIQPRRQVECLAFVVFKIGEFERGKMHGAIYAINNNCMFGYIILSNYANFVRHLQDKHFYNQKINSNEIIGFHNGATIDQFLFRVPRFAFSAFIPKFGSKSEF